jgi:hypothetical protein
MIAYKAVVCFIGVLCSMLGHVTILSGLIWTVLLAIPQLYCTKDVFGQRVCVIVGPFAPMLAVNNMVLDKVNPWMVTLAIVAFFAFVVFRPDTTAVLQLLSNHGIDTPMMINAKYCRRAHGGLATCNTLLSFLLIVLSLLKKETT